MLKEAVLDHGSTVALLRIAYDEGLIQEDPQKTDFFLEGLRRRSTPEWLRRQVLEQIVLTPRVKTFAPLPREGIYGPLIDEGTLEMIEPPSEQSIQLDALPVDIISGMLLGVGTSIPVSEFLPRLAAAEATLAEVEEHRLTHGKDLPTELQVFTAAVIRSAAGKGFDLNLPPDGYTQAELDLARRNREAYAAARPIVDCGIEFSNLVTAAGNGSTLVKTPFVEPTAQLVPGSPPNLRTGIPNEIGLFRVVATDLGKLTHRHTLRDTLKLSREAATTSLREHLPIWLDQLSQQDISGTELVQKEIKRAADELERISGLTTARRIMGYFAIPVDLLELILQLPPILGISLELISRGLEIKERSVTNRNRWLAFGNTYTLPT